MLQARRVVRRRQFDGDEIDFDTCVNASTRRIIDVEREALLLVCIALKEMGEPYAVMAFSGRGPQGVTVRHIKDFDEPYSNDIALRISSLEPDRYTRAGAAIRHATASLMQQSANEARLQGLSPFCLTIDRQAAGYLPRIFGANQYAMLSRPELLPTVLLDWMRRLLAARQG